MEVRVVSWNIHKGRDFLGRRVDIQHSLDLMARQEWDVFCLQEAPLRAVQAFSQRSSMPFAHGPTRSIRGGPVGNAVLIRAGAVAEIENLDISAHAMESRGALFALVSLPGHFPVVVSSTHFGLTRPWREKQVRSLLRFVEGSSAGSARAWSRVVVCGDFNDHADGVAHAMRQSGFGPPSAPPGRRALPSFPSIAPMLALDCIYFRGGVPGQGSVPGKALGWHRHSDHLPISASVEFSVGDDERLSPDAAHG